MELHRHPYGERGLLRVRHLPDPGLVANHADRVAVLLRVCRTIPEGGRYGR